MKFCAVVVWYNPDENSIKNIEKYKNFCSKVYIVDNSTKNNFALTKTIDNCVYIPNLKNLGIAKALNIGCQKAKDQGELWCMTMDQDSSWDNDALKLFISKARELMSSKNVSFSPNHKNQIHSVIGGLKFNREDNKKEVKNIDKVISSGNLINLDIWEKVGKFNTDLFIDEVDHEFCYRLKSVGYEIYKFQNIFMIHTLGKVKRTFFPRVCKHSGIRLFYIFRNMLYIKEKYYYYYKKNGYGQYMFFSYIQKLLEFNKEDLSYIHQGIKAFKNGEFGEYNK